ncbi:uncharacterized protein [Eurosta solidaginis]|uniref:uncharacterized protein n=1 Tax=Eurosta solidaginis TaxID=178769 RepID=UPI0035314E19
MLTPNGIRKSECLPNHSRGATADFELIQSNKIEILYDCLFAILAKVVNKKDQLSWSKVCGRFCRLYSASFTRKLKSTKYEENLLDDHIATHCAHLIGTQYSSLNDIKKVRLKTAYKTYFWKNLSKQHPEIEEVELLETSDDDLMDLLPLPNLKRLKCAGTKKLVRTKKSWQDIVELFSPDPGLNSLRHAPPLHHLENLEEVEIDCQVFKWWLVLGKLPHLKVLTLNKFNVRKCEYSHALCDCAADNIKFLVDGLLEFKNLEKLTFKNAWMTERTMKDIAKLTSLKSLCLIKTIQEDELTLNMFSDLVNLEELQIGNLVLNKISSCRFFRMCDKLKYLRVFSCDEHIPKILNFLTNMLSNRNTQDREAVKVVVCQSYFDSIEIYRICNQWRAVNNTFDLVIVEDEMPWFGRILDTEMEISEMDFNELSWLNKINNGLCMLWHGFLNMS